MSTIELNYQISRLHPVLRAFTRRFTSNRDESLDLVQDTILKALTNKDKFREDTNLKGWLFTIMRNTFINNYRKNQIARTSKDCTKELYFLNVEDRHTFNNPIPNFEYNDIWNQINSLRDEIRIPFKMYTAGFKYHEIAANQNIPLGTVKNRIFNARKEIQKKLNGN